jgi:hypothetical protein
LPLEDILYDVSFIYYLFLLIKFDKLRCKDGLELLVAFTHVYFEHEIKFEHFHIFYLKLRLHQSTLYKLRILTKHEVQV